MIAPLGLWLLIGSRCHRIICCARKAVLDALEFCHWNLSLRQTTHGAGAVFKAAGFLLVSLMTLVFSPYGGAYLVLLTQSIRATIQSAG